MNNSLAEDWQEAEDELNDVRDEHTKLLHQLGIEQETTAVLNAALNERSDEIVRLKEEVLVQVEANDLLEVRIEKLQHALAKVLGVPDWSEWVVQS